MSPQSLNASASRRGVTIIELTIIVAVIILLVSTLIMAGKYYINHSNRSACITNLNQIHKAIRSTQNVGQLSIGSPLAMQDLVGADKALPKMPVCPQSSGSYTLANTILPHGEVMVFCQEYDSGVGSVDSSLEHSPPAGISW
ncbi:hypothetical protein SAMN02745181_1187 [Rubritalea squalenifaciens DSM 18772]|uniref:Prepilin-type N-terminal cleavage/methylation domain-containing protein n=1 Tax=Rubritalea squalenifaciens DSM 18772 TaxID=1123071 RepID=A0A1M6GJH4_9BACT|nr:hypothetical protein [Rubritalea squalenifaciens]SHJ10084.1 hypothetical protein SAMN02745181_1187 [Rubritalea squalenifaciens DSM 18772]